MKIDLTLDPPKQENKKYPFPYKRKNEIMRGWYIHCHAFYVGYGWKTLPACPVCKKKSRKATWLEVYENYK